MGYKLIIMKDDRVLKEHTFDTPETLIGRRPHNSVILEDQTVSGKHALIRLLGDTVEIEDQGSTNGTYVNGNPITRQELQLGDRIIIGPYRITLQLQLHNTWSGSGASANASGRLSSFQDTSLEPSHLQQKETLLEITSGPSKGRYLPLTKVVTTIGTPGVAVVSITHRLNAYVLTKVEDSRGEITLNNQPLGNEPVKLQEGDALNLENVSLVFHKGN